MAKENERKKEDPKVTGTRRCGDREPPKAKAQTIREKPWTLDEIKDLPMAMVVFPGCIEGDRITYTAKGDERNVFLYGTANEIALYTIGENVAVKVGKKTVNYQRNVGRKQQEAVDRISDEMKGTGGIAKLAKEKGGNFDGYTLTVNNNLVTKESLLNKFFQEKELEVPATQAGAPAGKVKYLGGVELVVSAVIKPGSESYAPQIGTVSSVAQKYLRV